MLHTEKLIEYQRQREEDDRRWRIEQAEREERHRQAQAERERQWRQEDQAAATAAFKREQIKGWAVALWTLLAATVTWLIAILVR